MYHFLVPKKKDLSGAVLKVQLDDELRRVAIDDTLSIDQLEKKMKTMFPQLTTDFCMKYSVEGESFPLNTNNDMKEALAQAKQVQPPLLRIALFPGEKRAAETAPLAAPEPAAPEPSPLAAPEPVPSSTALCSNCKSALNLPYYKCINCRDFELCERCEPLVVHVPEHLLAKLRISINSLPRKTQHVFRRHLDSPPCDQKEERKRRAEQKMSLAQTPSKEILETKNEPEDKEAEPKKPKKVRRIILPRADESKPEKTEAEVNPGESAGETELSKLLSEFFEVKKEQQAEVRPNEDAKTEEQKVEPEVEVKPEPKAEEKTPEPQGKKSSNLFLSKLLALEEMGFKDKEKNISLLVKNVGDVEATLEQLLREQSF